MQSWWGSTTGTRRTNSASASSTSSYAVVHLPRDRDLISADEFLTDNVLDELWTWFCSIGKDRTDPQLVFVKMINSVSTCS